MDIRDEQSAILGAHARVNDFFDEWIAKYYAPVGQMQVAAILAQMTPEQKKKLEKLAGKDAFKQIEKFAAGGV